MWFGESGIKCVMLGATTKCLFRICDRSWPNSWRVEQLAGVSGSVDLGAIELESEGMLLLMEMIVVYWCA
jgi:hypothetical protein